MDRGQNGRGDFFGGRDPFAGFGGFGPQRSLISGFFGGRDPFDDPFFTQPFGGRMGGPGMFGPSLFGPMGGPFGDIRNDGFIEQAPPRSSGRKPVIIELDEEEGEIAEGGNEQSNHDSYVQEPDDESDGMESGQVQLRRDFNRADGEQLQARTFTYQSSSVTCGGVNGAYYTASKTRRTGSDGITVEERKEADTTTKEASHRISRGIHDKGHSLTRKLNSDGKMNLLDLRSHGRGMLGITCLAGIKMLVHLKIIILVTVAPVDVTDDLHGVGRFLEESKPVIQAAMGSRNLESSESLEER